MEGKKRRNQIIGDIVGLILTAVIFLIPFYFMFVQSIKSKKEANRLSIAWPTELHFENYLEVIKHGNYQLVTAFKNSAILTVFTVLGLIVTGAMAGYVIQRRKGKLMTTIQSVIMLGLMIPASILPTIRMLQSMGIYKTMFSMVMIEIALQTPFTIMLYRGFMSSIPVDLEEAASIDGCNRWQIFQKVIFPLLKPIQATIIILVGVQTFNDFTNPLYFLPGAANTTVQLTLYNYKGQLGNNYNLLFADIIIITVPMLILFLFFNKRIVAGMVAGAVKG
ncbi:MAG: carbohydrate ABC transporter permease [Clostridia bacterium]|nr:carbohydrate ABC transporter permease [Clostridia bacterium]MBQ6120301.1 carbohydrate ABC transporter permease [Clostridia bacterium]MBQ6324541.1 carbohydrate ABC transporter permease [Clostridia bacterium]MBQ6349172.1 carbohydrate ABC transporter permease [Clostridia bacterium]MBQ6359243.1 carbohydrate ABC transporter permease [Clostridia bacterium]